jgi:hypothetical protein
LASRFYSDAAERFNSPFWNARKSTGFTEVHVSHESVFESFGPQTALRVSSETQVSDRPCVVENFIVPGKAAKHPNLLRPMAFPDGVSVPALLDDLELPLIAKTIVANWAKKNAPRQVFPFVD